LRRNETSLIHTTGVADEIEALVYLALGGGGHFIPVWRK